MSVFNEIPCPNGECVSCDVLQRADESRDAWFSRLRARIAAAPRTCKGAIAHSWTPENIRTVPGSGKSYCIPCANARWRESDRRKRA